MFADIGTACSVYKGTQPITGWMYGATKDAYYVATDCDARRIKYIRRSAVTKIEYHRNIERGRFAKDLEAINNLMKLHQSLAVKLNAAVGMVVPATVRDQLDRIEHNRQHINHIYLNYLDHSTYHQRRGYAPMYRSADRWRAAVKLHRLASSEIVRLLRESYWLYDRLLDKLSESGVYSILIDNKNGIKSVLSESTLPQEDAFWADEETLKSVIAEATGDRDLPEIATSKGIIQQFLKQDLHLSDGLPKSFPQDVDQVPDERLPKPRQITPSWRKNMKVAAASNRLAAGTCMGLGNLALGVLQSVFDVMPSLGQTPVPIAVGVSGSIYVGLTQVSEGLEKLADALAWKDKSPN